MASAPIEKESHLGDATLIALPIKALNVYVASDSMLRLRKTTKAGDQGPKIATAEKTESLGINGTAYCRVSNWNFA